MNNQNLYLIIFLIFTSTFNANVFSQDIILKRNGESIEAEISVIEIDNIKYKKYNNLNGPIYIIAKSEVEKITFKNGTTEVFTEKEQKKELSLVETKEYILTIINEHGYEEDSFKSKYKATFEKNFLRLTELKKKQIGRN